MFIVIALISALNSCQSCFIYSGAKNFTNIDKNLLAQADGASEFVGSIAKLVFGFFHNKFSNSAKLNAYVINNVLFSLINLLLVLFFCNVFIKDNLILLVLWVGNRIINNVCGISRDYLNLITSERISSNVLKLRSFKNVGNILAIIIAHFNVPLALVGLSFISLFFCIYLRQNQELHKCVAQDSFKIQEEILNSNNDRKATFVKVLVFTALIAIAEMPHISEQMLYMNVIKRENVLICKIFGQVVTPFIISLRCNLRFLAFLIPINFILASCFLSLRVELLASLGVFIWGTNITLTQSYAVILASRHVSLKSFLLGLGNVITSAVYMLTTSLSCFICKPFAETTSCINYKFNILFGFVSLFINVIYFFFLNNKKQDNC